MACLARRSTYQRIAHHLFPLLTVLTEELVLKQTRETRTHTVLNNAPENSNRCDDALDLDHVGGGDTVRTIQEEPFLLSRFRKIFVETGSLVVGNRILLRACVQNCCE
jgi:hypothetical protein